MVGKISLLRLLVVLGVGLRMWPYAANTSLFLDEILVASNITGLPLVDLVTGPLGLDQVAPGGFLLLEKLSVLLLGSSERALRLVPLVFSILGVFLFRRLAERTLTGGAVALAVALFAIGLPFIRYAAEVKQYGIDATAAIALTLLALDAVERDLSTRRLLLTGIAGLVMVWFSQAAVLVMAGIGMALALYWLRSGDARVRRALTFVVPVWALASAAAVLAGVSSMTPATREFMDDFWRLGFPPAPLTASSGGVWLWTQALSFFDDPALLRYRWPMFYLALATLGVVKLWLARPLVGSLLVTPALVCVFAAVAHQYPFRGRLVLCLLPGLLLTVAEGAGAVARVAARQHPSVAAVFLLAVLWWPVAALVTWPPPYDLEHHRTVLRYLQAQREPGDAIHVFPLTRIGVLFYGPQYGLPPAEWKTSVCDRADTRAYLRDLDQYRGRARVWLLWSTARPFRVARAVAEQYLLTIGSKRQSLDIMSSTQGLVSAALYDLSDPVRLAAADAESFPAPPMPTDPRPGCRPWTQANASLIVR